MYDHDYLIHYNKNHDKLGRFAKSNGISGIIKKQKNKKKMAKVRAAKKAKEEEVNKTTDKYKKSDASRLSETDLNNRISRLKQEQEYKRLLSSNRSYGKALIEDALKTAGKTALTTAATSALVYVGKKAVAKTFNAEPGSDKYKELFPKKNK